MPKKWSKQKIVRTTIITLALLIGGFYLFINYTSIGVVNAHTLSNYGDLVTIEHKWTADVGSPADYDVQSLYNPKLRYRITVERSLYLGLLQDVSKDTYTQAQGAQQELQKLDPILDDIKKLGFRGTDYHGIILDYRPDHPDGTNGSLKTLTLYNNRTISFGTIQEEMITRLHQLITLIQSTDADIHRVYVEDPWTDFAIAFDRYASTTPLTEDELYAYLRKTNPAIGNFESLEKYGEELTQLQNNRFQFGFEHEDFLYKCRDFDETGTCTSIELNVRYEHLGLTPDNENLLADVTAILNLLDNTMQEITAYEIFFVEQNDEGEWFKQVRFTKQERDQFETVEGLIEELF
ncbi:hypothetical protein FLK61_38885 [Paenalkalicoccus suaedae]|uniref:Uncharacterized protein n=1 Tax=Paenalkalicoccus suaedae TaxID=2592382 RepID=A0A859FJ73_9BACI|nr:hypothetical protein [Paenalkalicoccus suaedae]QKS72586.1 hypothetical protein FLK61_38885 [Paenalkalicoccus suaedae]